MAAALRALPQQWQERFGYCPLLAESFTDPVLHFGTTYKATNWIALGASAGFSRDRLDFYLPNDRPKRLWGLELVRGARTTLRRQELPPAYQTALSTVPSGVLPVSPPQMESLYDAFAHVPDPRGGRNKRFRIRGVLTLVAMALLGGRRSPRLPASPRACPRSYVTGWPCRSRKGTRAFCSVPGRLMIHLPVQIKQALVDDVLVAGSLVFEDHLTAVLIKAERVDTPRMSLSRGIFCREKANTEEGLEIPLNQGLQRLFQMGGGAFDLLRRTSDDSKQFDVAHAVHFRLHPRLPRVPTCRRLQRHRKRRAQ